MPIVETFHTSNIQEMHIVKTLYTTNSQEKSAKQIVVQIFRNVFSTSFTANIQEMSVFRTNCSTNIQDMPVVRTNFRKNSRKMLFLGPDFVIKKMRD